MAVETIVPLLEMGSSGAEVLGIIDAALKEVYYCCAARMPSTNNSFFLCISQDKCFLP